MAGGLSHDISTGTVFAFDDIVGLFGSLDGACENSVALDNLSRVLVDDAGLGQLDGNMGGTVADV